MARTCTICSHADRKKIEAAIAKGDSLRSIALQFGVSHTTVRRHQACVVEVLQKVEIKQELATVATVREVLETLTWQMRSDLTDLFGEEGNFDIPDIRSRGLGRMLKSLTFKRTYEGPRDAQTPVDVVKVEAHSQQTAATSLLNAYTKLEIAKQFTDAQLLSDAERLARLETILNRARSRRDRQTA